MRKPFFKRRWGRAVLVLLGLGVIGGWIFYQSLFYVPTLPPVEPDPSWSEGELPPDPAVPLKKVHAQFQHLTEEAQRGREKYYELAVHDVDVNRFLAERKFPGRQFAQQVRVRFADGQMTVISICPMGTLATRWLERHTPMALASNQRLVSLTVRLQPMLVSADEFTLEPQAFSIGKIKMPSYVITNVVERASERLGVGKMQRTVQMPGPIRALLIEDGWFRIRGKTERFGGLRTEMKRVNELIERLLNEQE